MKMERAVIVTDRNNKTIYKTGQSSELFNEFIIRIAREGIDDFTFNTYQILSNLNGFYLQCLQADYNRPLATGRGVVRIPTKNKKQAEALLEQILSQVNQSGG